ncbi:hypothetical protein BD413DRAFT_192434 [Trametes elegans]|nr:hypothetical protein BD413DRAFT_192434 [Trametes elegans]
MTKSRNVRQPSKPPKRPRSAPAVDSTDRSSAAPSACASSERHGPQRPQSPLRSLYDGAFLPGMQVFDSTPEHVHAESTKGSTATAASSGGKRKREKGKSTIPKARTKTGTTKKKKARAWDTVDRPVKEEQEERPLIKTDEEELERLLATRLASISPTKSVGAGQEDRNQVKQERSSDLSWEYWGQSKAEPSESDGNVDASASLAPGSSVQAPSDVTEAIRRDSFGPIVPQIRSMMRQPPADILARPPVLAPWSLPTLQVSSIPSASARSNAPSSPVAPLGSQGSALQPVHVPHGHPPIATPDLHTGQYYPPVGGFPTVPHYLESWLRCVLDLLSAPADSYAPPLPNSIQQQGPGNVLGIPGVPLRDLVSPPRGPSAYDDHATMVITGPPLTPTEAEMQTAIYEQWSASGVSIMDADCWVGVLGEDGHIYQTLPPVPYYPANDQHHGGG